jgi:hypothetical protein
MLKYGDNDTGYMAGVLSIDVIGDCNADGDQKAVVDDCIKVDGLH